MNPSEHNFPTTDRDLLDILVDGELPEVQRRELLASLDHTPGGWRACALAFLEAQCLRESLGKVSAEPVLPTNSLSQNSARQPQTSEVFETSELFGTGPKVVLPRSDRRARWARRVGTFLAMAASFLATLGLGWWAGGLQRAGGPARVAPIAAGNLVASQQEAAVSGPSQLVEPDGPVAPPQASPMMTLALPDWGGGGPIHLPVVERDQVDPSLLYPDAHAFPSQLREALRRAGYQVRQSHELLPVPVQDGRHAILPVDQLDIHYVGNHVE